MKNRALPLALLSVCLSLSGTMKPLPGQSPPAATTIAFNLPQPALTSAGIYDTNGHLVRVLWTMKQLAAGAQTAPWDGLDQTGQAVPPGAYSYHIKVNNATYTNVGAIGNSGQPANAAGHTPANLESVAVDSAGAVYTANNWDEAGADFKKWDATGHAVYEANYQIRNGQPNGAPYSIATDDQYLYCGMGGWESEQWKNLQQVQRFTLKDGKAAPFAAGPEGIKDGHINIYEWPKKLIPPGTPPADAALMGAPLRALAISDTTIFVADALGGKIRRYDKATGVAQGEFPVPLPQAIALDAMGRVWVGHSHHQIDVFTPAGQHVAGPFGGLNDVAALAFGPMVPGKPRRLYVAASGAGQVVGLDVTGRNKKWVHILGQRAQPGDRAADRFFHLRGMAVDKTGNLFTIQVEPISGARLAKWSPEGKLLWEQFGAEFVTLGNYGASNPDDFYSMSLHHYRLLSHTAGTWNYANDAYAGDASQPVAYHSDPHGVPRVLRLGGHDFYFVPTGDGVQVYRIDGKVLRLVALVGGRDPAPDGTAHGHDLGQWTWHDSAGTGQPKPADIQWFKQPGQGHYSVFGTDVDAAGNIWFANTETHSIWEIPLGALDARGNPTYDWVQAHEALARDASPLGFEPNMAQHAADGSIYAFGWSKTWPAPQNNPFWMGGSTLVRFDAKGTLLWAVPLPDTCVGLDVIPGGGCMVGKGSGANIYHYSADGLLLNILAPGKAMENQTGWMDNHASVAVSRDPRDHLLDVFAEDDYVLRIGWYRVDDRNIQSIEGRVTR